MAKGLNKSEFKGDNFFLIAEHLFPSRNSDHKTEEDTILNDQLA